jgi:hypothetical protein
VNGKKFNTNAGKRTLLAVLNQLTQKMTSAVSKEREKERGRPPSQFKIGLHLLLLAIGKEFRSEYLTSHDDLLRLTEY